MQEGRKPGSTKATSRTKHVVGMDAHSRKLAISIWDGTDPWNPTKLKENPRCDIRQLRQYYEENVPLDSITIIEASTNSALLKAMLDEIGFRAEVVRSDVIADKQRKRKVCDINDARTLANAYIHGDIKEFVWTPSPEYAEYRDILFAYRDAVKETTRTSNRIWSICCRCGFDFDIKAGETKAASIREMIKELDIGGFIKERLEMLVRDYEHFLERRDELERLIAEAVVRSREMTALMQLPGVYFLAAFATQTVVEDARRFGTASKLAAYGGFAMIGNTSGEEEEKSRSKGGTGKPLDGEGRRDLKTLYCEAGHTVLNSCKGMKLSKWGMRLVFRGKHKNKAACAVGRKLLTYAWHIMRGDPTPNREDEAFFKRKMKRFFSVLGAKRMKELGYASARDFAEKQAENIYGHLPKADPTQMQASEK
ncbi:MAG: transposase [Kiritimatiellae bacterium]|nr:transposase [Kiritimatiellia bacterium]